MERIVDYRVLQTRTTDELAAAVQKELNSGWQPLGGPVVLPKGRVAQAVVRTGTVPSGGGGSMDTASTQVIVHGQSLTDRQR